MAQPNAESTSATTLRLLWPQWQGATRDNIAALIPELPVNQAQYGYSVGTAVLQAVLPAHAGPTATVSVSFGSDGLEHRDGIDAKMRRARSVA